MVWTAFKKPWEQKMPFITGYACTSAFFFWRDHFTHRSDYQRKIFCKEVADLFDVATGFLIGNF